MLNKQMTGYTMSMDYMLDCFDKADLCCSDVANVDLYNYLVSGEL